MTCTEKFVNYSQTAHVLLQTLFITNIVVVKKKCPLILQNKLLSCFFHMFKVTQLNWEKIKPNHAQTAGTVFLYIRVNICPRLLSLE